MWQPYFETLKPPGPETPEVEVFLPDFLHVVMGASGKTDREVHAAALQAADVPLYKRKGGGGTVLLGPDTIVVTLHAKVGRPFGNQAYFHAINAAMMRVFTSWKDLGYQQRGISDIAVDGRKIVGTSIYRRKFYLLYQASILANLDRDNMQRLLKHPPKEPDYRAGRSHGSFLTSLRELGIDLPKEQMAADLRTLMPAYAAESLALADRRESFR